MKRTIPIVSTIVVLAAALLMVRLGFWQLSRLHEKEVLLAHYAANGTKPVVPFQSLWPIGETALYRRVTATCPDVLSWKTEAGRTATGVVGWRHIALCGTGAEGPGLEVDVGTSQSATAPKWTGGDVQGRLTWAPNPQPLVMRLMGAKAADSPLIVAETPAPGLEPTVQPDPSAIPNNHLSYAVQWFAFAGIALTIYAILLWRRRVAPSGPPR